jgi:hypothetical protein
MIKNAREGDELKFEPVTPATVLEQGRFQLRVSIPSSRFTRSAQVEVGERATVASIERDLTEVFGECVEVVDACCVS